MEQAIRSRTTYSVALGRVPVKGLRQCFGWQSSNGLFSLETLFSLLMSPARTRSSQAQWQYVSAPARNTATSVVGCGAAVEIVQQETRGRSSSVVAPSAARAEPSRATIHQAWCIERYGLVLRNACLPQCSFRCSEPYATRGNLRGSWLTVTALQRGGSSSFHPGNVPSSVF
jgi:hypothetical protein